MGDILSQGEEPKPGWWPRRLALITVLAVVLAVVIVQNLPHHRRAPARAPRTASGSGQAPSATAGRATAVAGLTGQPIGVVGPTVPWDSSLRLPVAGQQPTWFYPATGRRVPIGGLPLDRSGYQFTRLGGGWAIQPRSASRIGCGSCAGLPRPVYFLADQAQSVTRIALADEVAPAATGGALWLTSYLPGTDTATAGRTAQEVSVDGAPLRPQVRLPAGYVIDRATERGLLLAPLIQRPGKTNYRLWDPATRQFSRAIAGVIAASATRVASTPRCAAGLCRAHVLDLGTGRDTTIRLPRGSSVANGAFSPDGAFLALQVSIGSGGNGGALAMQLEVAPVTSGRLTVVPGTWASSDALVGFGWPAGGDSLVAELSFTTKVQVASWRPGAARLAVAVVRPAQDSALIVG
jgi:hypothetical protein